MKQRIIFGYILREILFPFFLVLLILTFVLLAGRILQLMDLMINKGVGILMIGQLIALLLPSFLTITIPIALLISILIALGRLSRENEILVMKSAGLSLYQLFPPVALPALAAFALSLALQVHFVPSVNAAGRTLLMDIARQQAGIGIKEKVFIDDFQDLVLYANQVSIDGITMKELFISDNRLARTPLTIIARKGRLLTDPESGSALLRLENGSTHTVDADLTTYRKMDFTVYDIALEASGTTSTGTAAGDERKDRDEMTPRELIQVLRSDTDIPPRERNLLIMELNKRFALPLTCIVFAILALPLGIVKHRTAKSRAFVVGLGVVTLYYMLQLGGDALGETGKLHPVTAAWGPTVLLAAAGTWFFARAAGEKPPPTLQDVRGYVSRPARALAERLKRTTRGEQ